MATTQIANIIEPSTYLKYGREAKPEMLVLLEQAGILAPPPEEVSSQISAGGRTIDMPFWQPLSRTDPDIMDDSGSDATPDGMTGAKTRAIKHYWHKGWSQRDMSGVITSGNPKDPLQALASEHENYWAYVKHAHIIYTLQGVLADNVANDASDMLYSAYSDVASPGAANKISPAAINRARLTLGDHLNEVTAMSVHSKVYGDMLDQEAIDFVQPSGLKFKIPTFAGITVLVSDYMPVASGSNSDKYTCYLYGRGAFGFEEHFPDMAVEVERKQSTGKGGGETILHNRRHVLLHPIGFDFTGSSVASTSPTAAELQLAANWDRKYERKNCRIAQLDVN